MIAYRYKTKYGGGVVFAEDKAEAIGKIKKHYSLVYNEEMKDLLIWKYEDDDYYRPEVPDVYDCY